MKFLLAILLLICFTSTEAGPVFIRSQGSDGQGYTFKSGGACHVLTVAHVIGVDTNELALVVGPDGDTYSARVVASDAILDLALLVLVADDGETPTWGNGSSICSYGGSDSSLLFPVMEYGRTAKRSLFWLERVASPAGGLEHVVLGRTPVAEQNLLRLQFDDDNGLWEGDSGAAVRFLAYMHEYDTSDYQLESAEKHYLNQKYHNGRYNLPTADMLGIVTSIGPGGARVIPAETIHDFVINAIAPSETSVEDINVINDGITIVRAQRGLFTAVKNRGNVGVGSSAMIGAQAYNTVSFELDLGDKDTVIRGVDVIYNAPPDYSDKSIVGSWPGYYLDLKLGMDRPKNNPNYRNADCESPRIIVKLSQDGGRLVSCRLAGGRIARSAILDIAGRPGSIKSIEVIVR